MKYKHICNWCGEEFKTDDIDLDYCSLECYKADEEDLMSQLEKKV